MVQFGCQWILFMDGRWTDNIGSSGARHSFGEARIRWLRRIPVYPQAASRGESVTRDWMHDVHPYTHPLGSTWSLSTLIQIFKNHILPQSTLFFSSQPLFQGQQTPIYWLLTLSFLVVVVVQFGVVIG